MTISKTTSTTIWTKVFVTLAQARVQSVRQELSRTLRISAFAGMMTDWGLVNRQHDLSDMTGTFHQAVGLRRLIQREVLIDHGADLSGIQ